MIHDTAIIEDGAEIGENVDIGPFSIIRKHARIGDNSHIEGWCEIGKEAFNEEDRHTLEIGAGSYIRSHSVFYSGSRFDERLITGHRVTVREKTIAGKNLQIGTLGDIQGHCEIGDYVRFHSNVHIGQNSKIGSFVWIFPYVVLTNDPHPPSHILMGATVEDFVAIATMSMVLPGVHLGKGCLVGAHSSVSRDVTPDTVVAGSPAKKICDTADIKRKDDLEKPAYPWRRHFHRGYPLEVVEDWTAEFPLG